MHSPKYFRLQVSQVFFNHPFKRVLLIYLIQFILNILRELLNVCETDVILGLSPFTFDPSIVDLFLALSSRSRLILVATAIKQTPLKLAQIIHQEGITLLQSTP